MQEKQLAGKRCVALVRCSTPAQVDTSISAQNTLIEQYVRTHGMVCVDSVELAGVSGSVPGIRTDIDRIIARKRERNDFEAVVVHDTSRFTRAGAAHGLKLLYELRAAGLKVVFVKDDLPDGDLGDVMRGLQFFAGKEQVRNIAHTSTRGASFSLKEGRCAHCKAPPYAVDRLYTNDDGTPKHVIRNLPDGTQVKLDPTGSTVLERFGRNEQTGVPAHYLKQKNEHVVLVPGDPAHVQLVRDIFEQHFVAGWGYWRIARSLNERGCVGPRGGLWHANTVRSILQNPIYRGLGLANLFSAAIYYMRGKDGPVEVPPDDAAKADGRMPKRVRPRRDWVEIEEPRLANLLAPALRQAVAVKQQTRLAALATRQTPPFDRDRHRDSAYILKSILTARQGGYELSGRRTGRRTSPRRYYAISRAYSSPGADRTLRRLIPAEPLERAVLNALERVIVDTPKVRHVVREAARRELRAAGHRPDDLSRLRTERAAVERKLSFVAEELDTVGRAALKEKVQVLEARLREIDTALRRATGNPGAPRDADGVAAAVCARLADLVKQLPSLPFGALRHVLRQFVARAEVDLETRDVLIEFALPDWDMSNVDRMCLVTNPGCKTGNEAHRLILQRVFLCYEHGEYLPCDGCRRAA